MKEVLPPTPLKNRAAEFKLPASFYNTNNPPCTGCAGCEEEEEGELEEIEDENG